ncbi:MAG: hypothetical protein ACTSUB_06425 [Candidatus Thorarchaeota archaeon]
MKREKRETPRGDQIKSGVLNLGNPHLALGVSFFVIDGSIIDYQAYREVIPETVVMTANMMFAGYTALSEEFFRWKEIATPDTKYSLIKERIGNQGRN